MNLKKMLVTGGLLLLPSTGVQITTQRVQQDIHKNLSIEEEKDHEPVYYNFEITQELLKEIATMKLDMSDHIIFKRLLEDLKDTPLFMRGTRRHIGEFLGYDQYDYILKTYNNDTVPDTHKKKEELRINNFNHINFPLIFDEIGAVVPHTLDALLQDARFEKYRTTIQANDTLIVEMKQANGKNSLLYYESGKLLLATYATIGRGTSTSKGLFTADYRVEYKRSTKYDDAPMPYALHVKNNVFIHQGKVSSTEKSHGCVRIPGLYAEALYYLVTMPKMSMLNSAAEHKLNSVQMKVLDSLQNGRPQVLIVQ